jgi:hypothetical protein
MMELDGTNTQMIRSRFRILKMSSQTSRKSVGGSGRVQKAKRWLCKGPAVVYTLRSALQHEAGDNGAILLI